MTHRTICEILLVFSFLTYYFFFYCWPYCIHPLFTPSSPLYPPLAPLPGPSPHCCLWLCVCACMFFGQSLPVSPHLLPSEICQSVPCSYASGFIWFITLFCSLDSTYEWDHMVFVFLWLAYFAEHEAIKKKKCYLLQQYEWTCRILF